MELVYEVDPLFPEKKLFPEMHHALIGQKPFTKFCMHVGFEPLLVSKPDLSSVVGYLKLVG